MMSHDGHSLLAVQAKPRSILGLPGVMSNQPYTLERDRSRRRQGELRQQCRSDGADAFRPGFVSQNARSPRRRGSQRSESDLLVWNRVQLRRRTIHQWNARLSRNPCGAAARPNGVPSPAKLGRCAVRWVAIAACVSARVHPNGIPALSYLPPSGHPLHGQRQHRRHQRASCRRQGPRRRHLHPRRAQGLRGRLARRLLSPLTGCPPFPCAPPRHSRPSAPFSAICSPSGSNSAAAKVSPRASASFLIRLAPRLLLPAIAASLPSFCHQPLCLDRFHRRSRFSFPVFAWFLVTGARPPSFFVAASLVSLLIIVKHHPNIRRLIAGTESRFGAHKPA